MPVVRLSLDIAIPFALLLTAAAITVGLYVYRTTVPPLGRGRRILLGLLRGGALAALILLLLSPVLTLVHTSMRTPVLAVLLDASESMTAGEPDHRPEDELHTVLSSPAYREVTSGIETRTFTFGTRLSPLLQGDTIGFHQPATDIAEALAALRREAQGYPIDAALVISDGIVTAGHHPRYEAEKLNLPVYAIAVGDVSGQRDITITGVQVNEIVTAGTTTPVYVDIHATGLPDRRAEVQLLDGARILNRTSLALAGENRDYRVELSFAADQPGMKTLTARLLPVEGEMTTANNVRSRVVRVIKERTVVLMLAGFPSPDVPAIRQSLSADPGFDVRAYTQRQTGGFFEGVPSPSLLDSVDCVVLLGFPTEFTSAAFFERIRTLIETRSLPVFFAAGRSVDYARLAPLTPRLPVVAELTSGVEQLVSFEPSLEQQGNQLLSFGDPNGFERWESLPPIFSTATVYRVRAGAVILGYGRIQGTNIREPLLVVRAAGRLRSIALLGYGLWRWRLMAQRTPATRDLLTQFLGMTLRWLCSGEESRPVRVDLVSATPHQGEPVRFFGQVYDAALRPVDNARLRVAVRGMTGEFALDLRSTGNGQYEGSLDALPAGSFTFTAEAEANGVRYGEDRGSFSVGEVSLELQDTRMDFQTLSEIAAVTGGISTTPGGTDTLLSRLRSGPAMAEHRVESSRTVEFRHWPFSLAALLTMLTAEWVMRKRYGMV